MKIYISNIYCSCMFCSSRELRLILFPYFFLLRTAPTPGLKKTQLPSMDQLTAYCYGLTVSSPKFMLKHNLHGCDIRRLSLPGRSMNSCNPSSLEAEAGGLWVYNETISYILTKSWRAFGESISHGVSPPWWRSKFHCPSAGCHCHSELRPLQVSTQVLLCSVESVYWLLQPRPAKLRTVVRPAALLLRLQGGWFPGGFLQSCRHLTKFPGCFGCNCFSSALLLTVHIPHVYSHFVTALRIWEKCELAVKITVWPSSELRVCLHLHPAS